MRDLRTQLDNSLRNQLTPITIFAWVVAIVVSIIAFAFIVAIVIAFLV